MTFFSYAQRSSVTGRVTDNMGEPMPGVTIMLKGTTLGTISDVDGKYSLNVASDDMTIVFSFIGMDSQEIKVGTQTVINVILSSSSFDVDEVIVVGYGTQRKSDITGSVSSISQDRLESVVSTNVLQSVQGSSPGVYIKRSSGAPDSQPDIRIRGINSIKASSTPLIVVDGIPFTSGTLNDLAPSDIASMEVLKDASSSAIYGSRAANGVVLITTKSGTSQKAIIEFNSSVQFETIANKPDLMNGDEYLAFKRVAYENGGYDSEIEDVLDANELECYYANKETDWLDELTQTAITQNYQLSIRGGTKKLKYYVSGNYADREGIVINSGYKRMSLRNNFDFMVNDWLSLGNKMQVTNTDVNSAEFGSGDEAAYRLSPWGKLKEDDGSYTLYPMSFSTYYSNVVADNVLKEEEDKRTRLFNNMYLKIDFPFLDGLSYKLNFGLDINYRTTGEYWPEGTAEGLVTMEDENASVVYGDASTSSRLRRSWTLENIFDYTKVINKNNRISVTGMVSAQNYTNSEFTAGAEGFVSDDFLWHQLDAGLNTVQSTSTYEEWTLLSGMGRINYNLMDKYLFTLTGRSDGYSAFAENNKWSFFPSVGLGWNISHEPFMSNLSAINQMKIRLSYGQSGNQAIDPYSSLAQLDGDLGYVFGQTSTNGVSISSLANANLTWETTTALNLALD
jgi:TonB-linked SusC/RagA family outer membrane protein